MASRKELQVGQEWAVVEGYGSTAGINSGWGKKVTIVELTAYDKGSKYSSRFYPVEGGKYVKVEKTYKNNDGGTTTEQVCVMLRSLVSLWDDYVKVQHENAKNQEAMRIRQEEQRKFKQTVYDPALEELISILQNITEKREYISSHHSIGHLPLTTIQALTEILKNR
jgi:hypothetical protein